MTSISETMDDEPFTFKNYNTTLYQCFAEMFNKKELSDAILVCDNHRIHVHKFLLSASSSFFNNMFKKPHNNNLNITNVKYEDLLRVLDYIYKGQVAVHPDKLSSFLDATKKLSVPVDSGEMQELLRISERNVKPSKPQDCNSNVDVGGTNCDESIVKMKNNLKSVESSKIEKHNLGKGSAKSKIPGVLEVTRDEFFKRMFRAHAIPWPGDDNETSPASTSSVDTSSAQPSTSSASSQAQKPQNAIKDIHSSSKVAPKPKSKPQPSTSALSDTKSISEIKRLIKERVRNIEGVQNRIKILAQKGGSQKKLEIAQRELKVHEIGLAKLQEQLQQP